MTISHIASFSAAATSVALSSIAAGDLLIAAAYINNSATLPTAPAGWTLVNNTAGANTNAIIVYKKIAAGGETTSGTWTGASHVAVGQYRSTINIGTGANAQTGGNNQTTALIS